MRAKNRQAKQNGQILIIMLLIMAVVLTLGLTASRQVTTDLKVSRQQAESAKAYSAAESGLEKALAGLGTDKTDLEAGYVSATVEQQDIGGTSQLVWPSTVRQGEGMFFWLTGHHVDGAIDYDNYYNGSLTFCWQKADNNGDTIPAVVAALFYDQGKKVKYWALDDNDTRRANNDFTKPSSNVDQCPGGSGSNFSYSQDIDLSLFSNPVFLWIRVFYADAQLGFKGNANLPIQGYVYTSTGEVAPTEAPEVISRRIQAFKTFKQPDPILLEPLVSFGDIKAVMPLP